MFNVDMFNVDMIYALRFMVVLCVPAERFLWSEREVNGK